MKRWDVVAIVGVGLIGGSIGLALRTRRLARQVVGIGRRSASLRVARQVGAVTQTTVDIRRGVAQADLVVVCTPVDWIAEHVTIAAEACRPEAVITDAGSIKGHIVSTVAERLGPRARFVGSHPLAGGEQSGARQASASLFEGRVVVTTPTRQTPGDVVETVEAFWGALGAEVLRLSPTAHDRVVASTSHVPHLVAAALADAIRSDQMPYCGTGWRDTTRIAAGDPELWTQILLGNAEAVLKGLEPFERSLAALREALTRGDRAALKKQLTRAKRKRDALGN